MAGTTRLDNAISGDRAEQLASDLGHQKSRLAIQEVVKEYVGSSEFADRVKSIHLEALEADPARKKLKDWVCDVIEKEVTSDATNKRLDERIDARIETDRRTRGWKNKQFWVPTTLAAISALAAIVLAIRG